MITKNISIMTQQFTNNEGHAIITLCGRLDTSCAMQTQADINQFLSDQSPIQSVTVNAAELEYLSSSGLRILLSLAKKYKDFKLVEVNADVFDILSMTGFGKIMHVERALRQMSIEGCEILGVGGVGTVYRYNDDTIIKVFRDGTTIDEVRNEITMSKEAFVLGMPTAISFDIVKVAPQKEGGEMCYGLVYELLKAETLSTVVKLHPERIVEFARKYADLFLQLHQIEVPAGGNVPSAIERERQQIEHIRCYFPQENIDKMLRIIDSIPPGNRLLHLDLQTKNAMMQGDELMLIDMGEVGYGHPMLDMGHAYSAMVNLVGDYEKIIGMPRELGQRLWNIAIDHYMKGLPTEVAAQRKAQIEVISCVRNFSWLSLSDSFPESVVNECKMLFDERITKRFDYIMDVCKTFGNWTL